MLRVKLLLTIAVTGSILNPAVSGQSRRVNPAAVKPPSETTAPDSTGNRTVKEMFDEASAYYRIKITEFEQKKVPYSDALDTQARREQKQLAAKYSGIAQQRTGLSSEDFYYLGRLHFIAENMDAARENLLKFLAGENTSVESAQNARAIIVIISARKKNFEEAERLLTDYIKAGPGKSSERWRMETELAKAFMAGSEYAKASLHANEAYLAKKPLATDSSARKETIDELIDSGLLYFESLRRSNRQKEADAILDDMRSTAVFLQSPMFFYYSTDAQIKYQIETGRKPIALENYTASLAQAAKDFTSKAAQSDIVQRLKKREKHYKLLGEIAPEIVNIDQFFPGERKTLAELRGKVVLLDFWATWCVPCLEAFPSMIEWQQDFGRSGFVILGMTRYYGAAEGFPVDNANEIAFLKRFKNAHGLSYDFVVAKDEANHRAYGAAAIPTTVLIDRKGVIRYLESGTSKNRLEEMREMIARLVAEK